MIINPVTSGTGDHIIVVKQWKIIAGRKSRSSSCCRCLLAFDNFALLYCCCIYFAHLCTTWLVESLVRLWRFPVICKLEVFSSELLLQNWKKRRLLDERRNVFKIKFSCSNSNLLTSLESRRARDEKEACVSLTVMFRCFVQVFVCLF